MNYPEYVALYQYLTRGSYPIDCTTNWKRNIQRRAKKYVAAQGRLYEKKTEEDGEIDNSLGRELLHSGNINDVILKAHREGHFGMTNTMQRVLLQYVGKGIQSITKEIVRTCEICQKRQKIVHKRSIKMKTIPTPWRPFYMVGLDAVGPLEETKNGERYMFVAIDYLTRWPVACAVADISAKSAEKFLFDYLFQYHGIPTYLLTDRGSSFKAEYIDYVLRKLECRHLLTCAYMPNTNGLCERMNGTLVNTMAKLKHDDCDDSKEWSAYITSALLCIRTMKNEATRYTPSMLLYGYDLRTPATWPSPHYDYVEGEIEDEVRRRTLEIEGFVSKIREEAVENSLARKKKMKEKYDVGVRNEKVFKIGDKVLMKNHVPSDKWDFKYIGPFEVVKCNLNSTYHLVGPNSRKLDGAVNGKYLVPFYESKNLIPVVENVSRTYGTKS